MTRGCIRDMSITELPKVWKGEWGLGQVGPSPCFGQLPLALSSSVLGSFKSSRGIESNSKVYGPQRLKNRY